MTSIKSNINLGNNLNLDKDIKKVNKDNIVKDISIQKNNEKPIEDKKNINEYKNTRFLPSQLKFSPTPDKISAKELSDKKIKEWEGALEDNGDKAKNIIKIVDTKKSYQSVKEDLIRNLVQQNKDTSKVSELIAEIDKIPDDKKSILFNDIRNGLGAGEKINMKKEMLHYISELFKKNPSKANDILDSLLKFSNVKNNSNSLIKDNQKMEYIKDILHDITYPTDIDQRTKGTCASTAVQVKLAISDPKKYVEIATKLAKGDTWNGITPNSTYKDDKNDSRSLSSKVVQNAFMDYANGNTSYSSNKYENVKGEYKEADKGLTGSESERLEEKVFNNTDIDSIYLNFFVSKDEVLTEIDKSLKKAPVSFSVEKHAMLVLSKNKDGSYNVFTWGREKRITAEDMNKIIKGARIIDDSSFNSY